MITNLFIITFRKKIFLFNQKQFDFLNLYVNLIILLSFANIIIIIFYIIE